MSEPDSSFEPQKIAARTAAPPSVLRSALITGCYAGAMLAVAMLGALVAANRIPSLDAYAFERNAASSALFVILMLLPVLRYLNRPVRMFIASMTSWSLVTIAYYFAGFYFRDLFGALQKTPFEVLIEGAILYGVLAVAAWVCAMILHARRHPLAPARRTRPGTISGHR